MKFQEFRDRNFWSLFRLLLKEYNWIVEFIILYIFIIYFIKYIYFCIFIFCNFCIECFLVILKSPEIYQVSHVTLYRILFLERASYSKWLSYVKFPVKKKQKSWMIKIIMIQQFHFLYLIYHYSIVVQKKYILLNKKITFR